MPDLHLEVWHCANLGQLREIRPAKLDSCFQQLFGPGFHDPARYGRVPYEELDGMSSCPETRDSVCGITYSYPDSNDAGGCRLQCYVRVKLHVAS